MFFFFVVDVFLIVSELICLAQRCELLCAVRCAVLVSRHPAWCRGAVSAVVLSAGTAHSRNMTRARVGPACPHNFNIHFVRLP